jgi:hypothetical protein
VDLIGTLVAALGGEEAARMALADALKEAGQEEAAGKLARLLALPGKVRDTLLGKQRDLAQLEDEQWCLVDECEARGREVGAIEAYNDILRLLGEEVSATGEDTSYCDDCGHAHGEHDDYGVCLVQGCKCDGWPGP